MAKRINFSAISSEENIDGYDAENDDGDIRIDVGDEWTTGFLSRNHRVLMLAAGILVVAVVNPTMASIYETSNATTTTTTTKRTMRTTMLKVTTALDVYHLPAAPGGHQLTKTRRKNIA